MSERKDSSSILNKMMQILIRDYFFKPSISICDVENMIAAFEGCQYPKVKKWLNDFEDVISLFNLNELNELILIKRCMAGKTKLLIQNESKMNTWQKLKSLLISKFGPTCNSAELH